MTTERDRAVEFDREVLIRALIHWKLDDQPDKPKAVVELWANWWLARYEAEAIALTPPENQRPDIDGPTCWTCGQPCGHVYAQPIPREPEAASPDLALDVEEPLTAAEEAKVREWMRTGEDADYPWRDDRGRTCRSGYATTVERRLLATLDLTRSAHITFHHGESAARLGPSDPPESLELHRALAFIQEAAPLLTASMTDPAMVTELHGLMYRAEVLNVEPARLRESSREAR